MDLKPQATPNPTPEVPEFAELVVREPLDLLPHLEELQDASRYCFSRNQTHSLL